MFHQKLPAFHVFVPVSNITSSFTKEHSSDQYGALNVRSAPNTRPSAFVKTTTITAAAGEVSISLLRDNLVGVSCAVAACALTAAVYMFLPGSALVAEDEAGHLDDESLAKRESAPSPDMNVEDVSRRIWIFTTARYIHGAVCAYVRYRCSVSV